MSEVNDIAESNSKRPEAAAFTPARLTHIRSDNRRAFSLAELVLIVLILAVFAAIAVPRLDYAIIKRHKTEATARKIVTDLRRVRGLALANAATNTCGYSLNVTSAPHGYEIKNLDGGATLESHALDSDVACAGGSTFEFGPLGNLTVGSDTQMTVSGSGKSFTITITSATGMISCVES